MFCAETSSLPRFSKVIYALVNALTSFSMSYLASASSSPSSPLGSSSSFSDPSFPCCSRLNSLFPATPCSPLAFSLSPKSRADLSRLLLLNSCCSACFPFPISSRSCLRTLLLASTSSSTPSSRTALRFDVSTRPCTLLFHSTCCSIVRYTAMRQPESHSAANSVRISIQLQSRFRCIGSIRICVLVSGPRGRSPSCMNHTALLNARKYLPSHFLLSL